MAINFPETLKDILFIDIETVSCVGAYHELDTSLRLLWDKKTAAIRKNPKEDASEFFFEKAAIYSEFGKIIVIGMGVFSLEEKEMPKLRIKALQGHDEATLLQSFKELLETNFQQDNLKLCAHNGKEFDFPYLCRRMLIHGLPLPPVLAIQGKKPWEVAHLDTMELWKFGDRKSFTSLHLLATLFGIASSKEIMHGSEVNHYYYRKQDLEKITSYCLQDVVVTAQLFLKMHCQETIQPENIIFA